MSRIGWLIIALAIGFGVAATIANSPHSWAYALLHDECVGLAWHTGPNACRPLPRRAWRMPAPRNAI